MARAPEWRQLGRARLSPAFLTSSRLMEMAKIHERLTARFGERVLSAELGAKNPWFLVETGAIREVCRFLRDEPDIRCDVLSNLSGVDYKDDGTIEMVYHLYSYPERHLIVLKVRADRNDPVVPSVEPVWKAANWLEREIYDLLGVNFTDHPDLRRLLMPEDWVGHPLRKDFVEPDEYHGISTRRESLLR
jgi:NADH-quinone oxidoreductase subunit C